MSSKTAKFDRLKTLFSCRRQRLLPLLPIASIAFMSIACLDASAQKPENSIKIEKGKTPATIFTIEVPGPSAKTCAPASKTSDDPGARERVAGQYFKEKQKATISAKPKVKEASMRLSGSLCPSCLKALAARFQNTAGVISATVELPSQMKTYEIETSNEAGKLPRYANARVTYDSTVLSIDRIKDIVRANDLAFWKVEVSDK